MSDDEDLRGDVVAPALVARGVLRRLHRQRVQHDEDLDGVIMQVGFGALIQVGEYIVHLQYTWGGDSVDILGT